MRNTMPSYFSDSETGGRPRTNEQVGEDAWVGLRALVERRITDGSFGKEFPKGCPDGGVICGTDRYLFFDGLRAEVPDVLGEQGDDLPRETVPPTMAILDLIQFCYDKIAEPETLSYHPFHEHSHFRYDQYAQFVGRDKFREEVDTIFARNGLAYEFTESEGIERLAPTGIREGLPRMVFDTGDRGLDKLLERARQKYLSPDEGEQRDGLEKLWDAFERIKTLEDGDKKKGAEILLDKAAPNPSVLRTALENDMKALTKLGNQLNIRHYETTIESLAQVTHVDYLFGRMLSLVRLLLKKSGRGG